MNHDVQGVSCTISGWLDDVRLLLQSVQLVLENARPAQDAPSEVSKLIGQLPPMIRQCRSQIPTDRMVEVWLREVAAASDQMRPQLRGGDHGRRHGRHEPLPA